MIFISCKNHSFLLFFIYPKKCKEEKQNMNTYDGNMYDYDEEGDIATVICKGSL